MSKATGRLKFSKVMQKLKGNKSAFQLNDDLNLTGCSQKSLSGIYMENYNLLFNFGSKLTKDIQVIEDSIQNVFINLLKFGKKSGEIYNIKGYLLKTFRRQLILDIRKQRKLVLMECLTDNQFNYFNSPEQEISDKEEKERIDTVVKQCINNLPPRQQEIIYLYFNCELSYEDIAGILDITIESCYKTVYRSIKSMREQAEGILCFKKRICVKS